MEDLVEIYIKVIPVSWALPWPRKLSDNHQHKKHYKQIKQNTNPH